MGETWHEGPELNLSVGMPVEELRCVALQAAAQAWTGMSAISNRDQAMLDTADKFYVWLTNTRPTEPR